MQVLYERCAGLDVHKKTVVVALMLTGQSGRVHKEVRTFATTTTGLLALADWLVKQPGVQAAFLLNPTRVTDLQSVADAGEVMPQKSTYFFPKLASGLVDYPVRDPASPS